MAMTVVVTRNAPERFRGFLASCMLELAPGVYASPGITRGVRQRIWEVCTSWQGELPPDGCVLMTFVDRASPGGLGVLVLGCPRKDLVEHEGVWLARRDLPPELNEPAPFPTPCPRPPSSRRSAA
ncbi:MAG: type I-E CRISPR-associated endoribonuclease Cas2 [Deltaproteobacteria bacterium]|nr:type I-E CRISPR-associated endoribonuclease Cas2 [Deltaproteobacteria bacterium]